MLPTKLSSSRRGSQTTVRRATFGSDAGLVALRYEKTVQAEPPIPFVSRSSIRSSRRPSTSSTASYNSHHPIVVAPPLSPVPPPTEEHPALRTSAPPSPALSLSPSPSPRVSPTISEEWKRDSGVARTNSTSTSTIHEEDDEDECCQPERSKPCKNVSSATLVMLPSLVSPVLSKAQRLDHPLEDPFMRDENSNSAALTSVCSMSSVSSSTVASVRSSTPPPPASHPAPAAAATATSSPRVSESKTRDAGQSAATSLPLPSSPLSPRSSFSSSPRKMKGISLRSASRFRTPSLTQVLAPIQPLWRGSEPQSQGTQEGCSEGLGPSSTATTAAPGALPTASAMRFSEEAPKASTTAPAAATTRSKLTKQKQKHALSSSPKSPSRFWHRRDSSSTSTTSHSSDLQPFIPLDISIPSDNLLDHDYFLTSVSFSNRGSIMFGANDAPALDATDVKTTTHDSSPASSQNNNNQGRTTPTPTAPSLTPTPTTPATPASQSLARPSVDTVNTDTDADEKHTEASAPQGGLMSPPDIRVLAADVEKESQKVRSLYDVGDGPFGEPGSRRSYCERLEPTPEVPSEDCDNDPAPESLAAQAVPVSGSSSSLHYDLPKSQLEYTNGLEDWNDLEGARIDRYGFITLPPPPASNSEVRSLPGTPRKKRSVLQRRDPTSLSVRRTPTRKMSARSLNTQGSELSISPSLRSSRSVIRQASNLLPHNRDRRWMDEAGEMLNTSPSLQDIVDEVKAERLNDVMKRKELERSEKWRRMAKVVNKDGKGQGMGFEFDVQNPKLIERTWKGIPDRWRGAAWWSFLATSAKEDQDSATEERIIADFHKLQLRSSPDDVQIDLDVPRTINRHIMFRRRYRGGQRLMFRVLHAISIYFPETGYVQGMASLVATLLCYFDEEKCFVMVVRLWQLRGLARLYRPGFEELMAAMKDFNDNWLNKDVAKKLDELCIDTTAYGTRWYLTLFNLSIPFAAQLRVWDVFLLIGNSFTTDGSASEPTKSEATTTSRAGEYDVLHATSAALAQALREVLMDSDFENAMKALTSSISIKDEDLLLKVMKAEWKTHHGKKRG
ncbi:rab-GTPase-TBC domain-containing protein [Dactylonectria estremocensis]|uniref:Rab-GTPase-TBC domain-containing protein n=1 Tax=Dactylonectria estremocensis TaxID=1079267 RepID=A0A9P9F6L2_9HYPO|nr:rab-GTPase-TBC domain-containing protein [Dactylonectria estremocensis]